MTIPVLLGLMVLYAVLSKSKFAMQRDPSYRRRVQSREEIRERHARNRRRRAAREETAATASEGTKEDAASSCCA
jgi:hypothetical protein